MKTLSSVSWDSVTVPENQSLRVNINSLNQHMADAAEESSKPKLANMKQPVEEEKEQDAAPTVDTHIEADLNNEAEQNNIEEDHEPALNQEDVDDSTDILGSSQNNGETARGEEDEDVIEGFIISAANAPRTTTSNTARKEPKAPKTTRAMGPKRSRRNKQLEDFVVTDSDENLEILELDEDVPSRVYRRAKLDDEQTLSSRRPKRARKPVARTGEMIGSDKEDEWLELLSRHEGIASELSSFSEV